MRDILIENFYVPAVDIGLSSPIATWIKKTPSTVHTVSQRRTTQSG
ncbi:hypothetical protein [Actinopolyspora erythraea]|nr:hypothetical protein [Actinopolyspora erythraea]